jgi:NAD(P)-dependent dehydrogenase (short-subunit alcohol dehydrogenase family)
MPRTKANSSSDQSFVEYSATTTGDRPNHGLQDPMHGTILPPVAVVGASGTIGRTVVDALGIAGRPVLAHSGRIRGDADAALMADDLRALGRPVAGAVVAIPPGESRGRVLDHPSDELRACLEATLLPQLAIARQLIPLLAESGRNGTYLVLGGPGSETPWAGYGHRSIAMAALRMLAQVLHDEARAYDVRVHLLSIDSPVRAGDVPAEHECPEWPTAAGIGRRVVQLIERANADESAQTIVSCRRRIDTASRRSATRAFPDVPSFLASLKMPNRREVP